MKKTLILGIGNILCGDDGIGSYIANYLNDSEIEFPPDVEIIDGGTAGFDLLSLMKGRKKIIIIDAINVNDVPGSIYHFTPDNIKGNRSETSLHQVGISEVIRMLKVMGDMPEIEIIGIVPENLSEITMDISDTVKDAIPNAIQQILNAANNIQVNKNM